MALSDVRREEQLTQINDVFHHVQVTRLAHLGLSAPFSHGRYAAVCVCCVPLSRRQKQRRQCARTWQVCVVLCLVCVHPSLSVRLLRPFIQHAE